MTMNSIETGLNTTPFLFENTIATLTTTTTMAVISSSETTTMTTPSDTLNFSNHNNNPNNISSFSSHSFHNAASTSLQKIGNLSPHRNTSYHDKFVAVRRRSSGGGSHNSSNSNSNSSSGGILKRRGSLGKKGAVAFSRRSNKWLVDYRRKQANLSSQSLLRLRTLVQDEQEAKDQQRRRLKQRHTASSSSSSGEDKDEQDCKEEEKEDEDDPLASSSEHSINLGQLFTTNKNKNTTTTTPTGSPNHSQQKITFETISIKLTKEEKIQFLWRNPDFVKVVQKALQQQQQQQQQNPHHQHQGKKKSKLRREIKCYIPHERFKLPKQVKLVRGGEHDPIAILQASSNHLRNTFHGSAKRLSFDAAAGGGDKPLHSIKEASERGDGGSNNTSKLFSVAGCSRASLLDSCTSFATESVDSKDFIKGEAAETVVCEKKYPATHLELDDEDETEDEDTNTANEEATFAEESTAAGSCTSSVRSSIAESTAAGSCTSTVRGSIAESTVADTVAAVVMDPPPLPTSPHKPTQRALGNDYNTEYEDEDEDEGDEEATETEGEYDYDSTEVGEDSEYSEDVTEEAEASEVPVDPSDNEGDPEELEEEQDVSGWPGPEDSETEGEESIVTSCTSESSNNNNMHYGLSVYLSTHSRREPVSSSCKIPNKKSSGDSYTATSATGSLTAMSLSNLDESRQSSSNRTHASHRTHSSHRTAATNRTSNSAPSALLGCGNVNGNDSKSSLCSTRSDLDESLHASRSSLRLEDLSRASSAPLESSHQRSSFRGMETPSKILIQDDSRETDTSYTESEFDDNSTSSAAAAGNVNGIDHRRRTQQLHDVRRTRSLRAAGLEPDDNSKSAIIPRSNTPQGARRASLLRSRSGDTGSTHGRTLQRSRSGDTQGTSRTSKSTNDARPRLPPRNNSKDKGRSSNNMEGSFSRSASRRRLPPRSKSMDLDGFPIMVGTSGRRGSVTRTKSGHRDSFLGGSRIKKWGTCKANKNGQGLSLLEQHLTKGAAQAKNKNQQRPKRRGSGTGGVKPNHQSIASLSVPSLLDIKNSPTK